MSYGRGSLRTTVVISGGGVEKDERKRDESTRELHYHRADGGSDERPSGEAYRP